VPARRALIQVGVPQSRSAGAAGRHTFATICLMSGANPSWVARQLGHASSKMLFEVYSRWIEGADKGLERGKVEAWIGPQLVHKRRTE
jgi:integrase